MTLEVSKSDSNNKRKQFLRRGPAPSPFFSTNLNIYAPSSLWTKREDSRREWNEIISSFNEWRPAIRAHFSLPIQRSLSLDHRARIEEKKEQPREVLKINRNFSLAFYMRSHYATTEESTSRRGEKNASTIIEAYEQSLQCRLKSCAVSDATAWMGRMRLRGHGECESESEEDEVEVKVMRSAMELYKNFA